MKKKLKQKSARFIGRLIPAFAGIAIILIILELGLKITGGFYQKAADDNMLKTYPADVTILCVGDSYTFGLGAAPEFRYPTVLEKKLHKKYKSSFCVVNAGVCGINTSQIKAQLPTMLQYVKPDIILLMAGGANRWNTEGFYQHQIKKPKQSFFNKLAHHISIFKLTKLFIRNIQTRKKRSKAIFRELDIDKFTPESMPTPLPEIKGMDLKTMQLPKINDPFCENLAQCVTSPGTHSFKELVKQGKFLFDNGKFEKSVYCLLTAAKTSPIDRQYYHLNHNLGLLHYYLGQPEKALFFYKRSIQCRPFSPSWNYIRIGETLLLLGQNDRAWKWIFEGIKANPYESEFYHAIRTSLNELSPEQKRERVNKYIKDLKTLPANNSNCINDFLACLHSELEPDSILHWVVSDIKDIIKMANKANCEVILMDYLDWDQDRRYAQAIKELAVEQQVGLIANTDLLKKIPPQRLLDFFAPDGHPNARGYELMSENIANSKALENLIGAHNGRKN